MKVFVTVNNVKDSGQSVGDLEIDKPRERSSGWYVLVDSAVSNTGKPFYVPDHLGKVTVSLSPVIRIDRLGKSVADKFAHRYFHTMAPGVHFRLSELAQQLKEEGLPTDASVNFDRSLFVGDSGPFETDSHYQMIVNGELKAEWNVDSLKKSIGELLSEISRLNTVKMGDLLIPGLSGEMEIKRGDLIEVRKDNQEAFRIKVK